jgi:threonine/homoserine/homoserine lactone efflux protein
MPSLDTLIVFTLAAVLLNLSPGPSNLYVMARSVAQGARAGVVAALGLAAGSLVHVAASAIGLAALLHYSASAFTAVKFAGAAYLIWLGIQHLRRRTAPMSPSGAAGHLALPRIFRQSVLVETLNPKTALFFLAFLPQFADPAAGALAPQLLLLGLIVTLTAIPCDLMVAAGSGAVARLLLRRPYLQRLQDRLSGGILIGLGAFLALSRRAA